MRSKLPKNTTAKAVRYLNKTRSNHERTLGHISGEAASDVDGSRVIRNHKGTWCPYSTRFCQEGICSSCQLYRKNAG
jgi:hypothetical protein